MYIESISTPTLFERHRSIIGPEMMNFDAIYILALLFFV